VQQNLTELHTIIKEARELPIEKVLLTLFSCLGIKHFVRDVAVGNYSKK